MSIIKNDKELIPGELYRVSCVDDNSEILLLRENYYFDVIEHDIIVLVLGTVHEYPYQQYRKYYYKIVKVLIITEETKTMICKLMSSNYKKTLSQDYIIDKLTV